MKVSQLPKRQCSCCGFDLIDESTKFKAKDESGYWFDCTNCKTGFSRLS